MRTIKQLLEVMLKHQELFETGLCRWSNSLYSKKLITEDEVYTLWRYIEKNRPSAFSSINAFMHQNQGWYWKVGDIKPRIKWIKQHIKRNS
jgi:hypothetical protein